ncbi:hypothetical protein [Planctomycetes bacterium TBK1r]|uniref:Chromosome partition protein Smc n=1 Tax=Stieleria magnilauensis TaxID=2527963 RepID=A0ABX5XVK4_9BACT|nr:hypothetical protein TBK1r_50810 [Planctomycetes bacterium TBK1r]
MAQTKIEITADAQKAAAEYDKLTRKQNQQEDAAKQTAATSQQTARQTAAAQEAAANKGAASYNRIIRELKKQGPEGRAQAKAVEQYLRETGTAGRRSIGEIIGELEKIDPAAAASASAIQDNVAAAANTSANKLARLATELEKLGPEGRKQASAVRGYLQRTGQDGSRSIKEILGEIGKIDDEAGKVARKAGDDFTKAGKAGQSAFGSGIRSQLTQMATAYISINAAASVYRRTVEAARDAQRESVETLLNTASGNQKLLQVATDAEDFEKLTGKADELAAKYGILREHARELVFSARSEGFEELTDFIAANAGNRVIDVQAQSTVAGQVPALFQDEGIGGQEAINAVLVGAAKSRLNFEEIARALPAVAASAAPTEASFDESVATLSVLAGKFKSGETAGDRIAALAAKLNLDTVDTDGRKALADRGLIEAVQALKNDLSAEQRAAFLGESKELNEAYNAIAENLGEIQTRTSEINAARAATGTDRSATAVKRAIAEARPDIVAARDKIAADNQAEIEAERALGTTEAKRQAERQRQKAREYARGDNAVTVEGRAAARTATDTAADALDGLIESTALSDFQALAADAADARRDKRNFGDIESQRSLEALTFGATALGRRRSQARPGEQVRLSRDETQTYLSTLSGETIDQSRIDDNVIRQVTNQVTSAASETGGRSAILNNPIVQSLSHKLLGAVPFNNVERQTALKQIPSLEEAFAFGVPSVAPQAISAAASSPASANNELTAAIREQNQLQREAIALQRETADASKSTADATRTTADGVLRTADNTERQPADASAGINAASRRRIPDPI